MAEVPVINEEKLNAFGQRLFTLYATFKTDGAAVRERWLQNLRQFRGIYDSKVSALIAKDQSKAYPKMTRWKVIGTVARLLQMLFPNTEKNYAVLTPPFPDLSVEQLQQVLNELVAKKAAESGEDPRNVLCSDEEIEKAISQFADGKAERMELKIDDDLQGMEYITLARKVVFSATLYNVGILDGPLHEKIKARTWQRDPNRGGYVAVEVDKYKPLFEFSPVWDNYFDMTAVSLDKQSGRFQRKIMTRAEVEALALRPDFMADRINKWLKDHTEGNHVEEPWESEIKGEPKSDRITAAKDARKYEVAAYYGGVTGHELRASGVTVAEESLGKTFDANVWLLDNIVIKSKLAPFGAGVKQQHVFVFEDDDLSLLGNGQCDSLRDSQMSICEVARAAQDNASVIGPMVEVNDDLLTPGQDVSIRKHKTWRREGEGQSANMPAVRDISVNSHLPDLLQLLAVWMDFADKESGLPPPSMGDVSGGGSEALRTQKNASMFLGAAALPIRDTVRNFDTFTISVISALIAWNRKYDPNPSRDGDFGAIGRGSTSLIAKEVLGQALNDFRATLTPDELPHVKSRKLLIERMKVMDLPVDEILEDEEVAKKNIAAQQQRMQAQLQGEMQLTEAQAGAFMSKAMANIAQAKKLEGSLSVDTFNAVMKALESGQTFDLDAHKAETDRIKAEKPTGGGK